MPKRILGFSLDFDRRVLLLAMAEPLLMGSGMVESEYFQTAPLRHVGEVVKRFTIRANQPLHGDALLELLRLEPENGVPHGDLMEEAKRIIAIGSGSSVKGLLPTWAKDRGSRLILEKAIAAYKQRDFDQLDRELSKAGRIGSLEEKPYSYLDEAKSRVDWLRKVASGERAPGYATTGIDALDQCLDGHGLGPGQQGIFLAASGVGKSAVLVSVGRANLELGARVLHVTIGDLSASSLGRRYDLSILAATASEILSDTDAAEGNLSGFFARTKSNLDICFYPPRRLHYKELMGLVKSKRPDLVIVDYGMLMIPSIAHTGEKARLYDLGDIYLGLREVAIECNVPLWTAIQAQRSVVADDVIPDPTNVAECYEVIHHADVIVGLRQNDLEKRVGKLALKLGKNREEESGQVMDGLKGHPTVRANWGRMRVYSE